MPIEYGFIGAGNMGLSIIKGLLASGFSSNQLIVSEHHQTTCKHLKTLGITVTSDNLACAKACKLLVVAVHPKDAKKTLYHIKDALNPDTAILSVVAGLRCEAILAFLQKKEHPIIRCMPNLAALVQASMTSMFANTDSDEKIKQKAEMLMRGMGSVVWLPNEKMIDMTTALSGSGTAFFLAFMQAMVHAGNKLGLDESLAKTLTLQTALGSAKLALESQLDLTSLQQKIAVKGGTTAEGLNALKQSDFDIIVETIISKTYQKAKALNESFSD
jgi:pyrroline-5-carboxylate reductase